MVEGDRRLLNRVQVSSLFRRTPSKIRFLCACNEGLYSTLDRNLGKRTVRLRRAKTGASIYLRHIGMQYDYSISVKFEFRKAIN